MPGIWVGIALDTPAWSSASCGLIWCWQFVCSTYLWAFRFELLWLTWASMSDAKLLWLLLILCGSQAQIKLGCHRKMKMGWVVVYSAFHDNQVSVQIFFILLLTKKGLKKQIQVRVLHSTGCYAWCWARAGPCSHLPQLAFFHLRCNVGDQFRCVSLHRILGIF